MENKKKPFIIWLTGLSGSGKTTIGREIKKKLEDIKVKSVLLDGDEFRKGISDDLGFLNIDRNENIRRATEVSKIILKNEVNVIAAFISPLQEQRLRVRSQLEKYGIFIEIFVNTPLEVCINRDPKGLYAKARKGEIKNFTGIDKDAPYEKPSNPEFIFGNTPEETVDYISEKIFLYLKNKN